MRRVLLGGLGLALSVLAAPAAAQDARTPQPQRAARLGAPTAVPDPPPTSTEITPAGLLRRQGGAPVPAPMPGGPGVPTAGMPTGGVPVGGMPMTGMQMGSVPAPAARPSVVEDRGTGTGAGPAGQPTALSGVPTVVPSVSPNGAVLAGPGLECPLYGDCPVTGDCPVGAEAVGRVRGCGRWWTSAEYLMWWTHSADLPPLVTTSSPQFNGILGTGDTRVLLGGPFGETFHSGGRFTIGRWLGDDQKRGFEGRFFFVGQASETWTATTDQFGLLARPFNNVNPNTAVFPNTANFGQTSQVVVDPAAGSGSLAVQLENMLWGAEANYRRRLLGACNPCLRLDWLAGYRYLHMHEKLTITENFVRTVTPGTPGFPATSGAVVDRFRVANDFHGGQIGFAGEIRRGRWSLDGRATVAFGNLTRTVEIGGSQQLTLANGSVVTANGGLLAVPGANIGKFTDNVFAVVPEVGVNLGYQLTSRLRLFVGYNFIYFGNAMRAPDAIDTNIDAARIPNFLTNPVAPVPGTPRPQPRFESSGLFIQGINFGLQFNW